MNRLLFAVALCATFVPAHAQQPAAPATPAATAAPAAPIARHNCEKPDFPGRLATPTRMKAFDRDMEALKKCLMDFANEQKRLADAAVALSNQHIAAGNAAIGDYNDHVKAINKQAGKDIEERK